MFHLEPDPVHLFRCPKCGVPSQIWENVIFMGKYTLAYCTCHSCGTNFYHTFPTGHAQLLPVAFSDDKKYVSYPDHAAEWWAKPLLNVFFKSKKLAANIEKLQFKEFDEVVLLICLDDCYGHSLTNLLNAHALLQNNEVGVIVVIQKAFRWMLPDGIAEAWIVDVDTRQLNHWIENLDGFIKEESSRFSKIRLHNKYMPPDFFSINYENFTQTKKFDLETFASSTPVITFICREDRSWINGKVRNFFYFFLLKTKVFSLFKKSFARRQNKLFSKVAQMIKKEVKDAKFYAVGFGKSGGLTANIQDLRITGAPDKETELNWCKIYSQSHLIIGVHGSNMLIPTALSAGFINILPRHKISNYAEDVTINYRSNFLLYLSRHLDQFSPPSLVAKHAVAMLKGFKDQEV